LRFLLTYDGPLPSNGSRLDKHHIRRQLHPQLRRLWEVEEALVLLEEPARSSFRVEGFDFVPVATKKLELVCQLSVMILQPGPPGQVMERHGGDIDNRLKTLFDSLGVPPPEQVRGMDPPTKDEQPFYCVLEDDLRITRLEVKTEQLLRPGPPDEVRALITVVVRPTKVLMGNLMFLGGWLE